MKTRPNPGSEAYKERKPKRIDIHLLEENFAFKLLEKFPRLSVLNIQCSKCGYVSLMIFSTCPKCHSQRTGNEPEVIV